MARNNNAHQALIFNRRSSSEFVVLLLVQARDSDTTLTFSVAIQWGWVDGHSFEMAHNIEAY